MENLTKNLKIDALSRYLNIKSIKKYFIKNLIKNFKKAPYQKKNFIKKLKNALSWNRKNTLSKNIIKNLKKCLIMSKKDTFSKKTSSRLQPYQGTLKRMQKAPYQEFTQNT